MHHEWKRRDDGMRGCANGDVSFQLPASWTDATSPRFCAPSAEDAEGPSIRVSFRTLAEDETIRSLADERLLEPSKPGYRLVDFDPTEDLEVGGRPALQLRFLSAYRESYVIETVVWVEPMRGGDPVATVFTAIAPVGAALDTHAHLAKLLRSVRFGDARVTAPDP
jgi:hypothetical protein